MTMLRVPVSAQDHIRGDDNAAVTLVEYGDYECPFCAAAYPVVESIRGQFDRSVRFVFRHFPLTEIHPLARPAAEAAEFAGANGRFWQMHDTLFTNHARLGLPLMFAAARSEGLSAKMLEVALADEVFAPKVQADFLGGVRSGVNGTPAFFLQNVRYDGSYDHDSLGFAVAAAVAAARPSVR